MKLYVSRTIRAYGPNERADHPGAIGYLEVYDEPDGHGDVTPMYTADFPGCGVLAEVLLAVKACRQYPHDCEHCPWNATAPDSPWSKSGARNCWGRADALLAACRAAGLLPEGGRDE